jgi:thiol:disulfide interchange protein
LPQATTAPAQSATDVIAPTDSAPATSASAVSQATEAPAAAPAENVTAVKPVFIDFYAPW